MRMITGLGLGLTLVLAACNDPSPAATHDAATGGGGGAEASGGIADGVYACGYNSGGTFYGLGEIVIYGARYSGFSGGMRGTYSMNAEGGIAFSDGFEGTPDGFRVEGTVLKRSDGGGEPFIEMMIVSPSGNMLTVTCEE